MLSPLPPGTRIRLVEPAYALDPAQAAEAVALLREHGLHQMFQQRVLTRTFELESHDKPTSPA